MINWDDIRFFVAAQRAGSLAGAARELAVDQSTVSRRLVAFEKSLGVKLFDRTPDGLVSTVEGKRLSDAAARVERAAFDFERSASGEDARLEGNVKLATSDPLASSFLFPRLACLRERYPQINLEFVMGRQMVDLVRREADLALRICFGDAPPGEGTLIAKKLSDVALAIYGQRSYVERLGPPTSDADLARFDFLRYEAGFREPGKDWIEEHIGQPKIAMRCETMVSMRAAVTSGYGLGVLFCFIGDREPDLVRVSDTIERVGLWLVVHPDLKDKPRIRAVIDTLGEIVQSSAPLFRGEDGKTLRSA